MNRTYQFLTILKNGAGELLVEDFVGNLKKFEYLINQRFIVSSCELDMFLKELPEYMLDIVENKDNIIRLFANAEETKTGKIYAIEPLDKEDISVVIKFNFTGKIEKIMFFNDKLKLTLSNGQDIVVLERKGSCIKLVHLFKNHYSLNKGTKIDGQFTDVVPIEKSKLERDIRCGEMLLG